MVLQTSQSSWSQCRTQWWCHTTCWSGWRSPQLRAMKLHNYNMFVDTVSPVENKLEFHCIFHLIIAPVYETKTVVHIHLLTVDSNPLIEILSFRQHDGLPQVSTSQSCFGMFEQLILVRALWDVLLRLKSLRWATATENKNKVFFENTLHNLVISEKSLQSSRYSIRCLKSGDVSSLCRND